MGRLGVKHERLSSGRCGKDYSITKIYNWIDLSNCRIITDIGCNKVGKLSMCNMLTLLLGT